MLLIDTGGGGMWMVKPALERLGFNPQPLGVVLHDTAFTGGRFPIFDETASIPAPLGSPNPVVTGFGTEATQRALGGAQGILGHTWLAGRVWVFDYPRRRVMVYAEPPAPRRLGRNTIPMRLKQPMVRNNPRIQVVIDGDTVDVLLDTGATSELSAIAVDAMGAGPSIRASSFAAARLWNSWHKRHPNWRVVHRAEATTGADAIEVPSMRIAGHTVGPVWFVKRPNRAYDEMMSDMTDKPILAAIGGEAMRQFKVTLDYPRQRATFEFRRQRVAGTR